MPLQALLNRLDQEPSASDAPPKPRLKSAG
jgi:hypothetical protein